MKTTSDTRGTLLDASPYGSPEVLRGSQKQTTLSLGELQRGFSEMIQNTKIADKVKQESELADTVERLRSMKTDIADAVSLVQSIYETCEEAHCKILFRQLAESLSSTGLCTVPIEFKSSFFNTPTQKLAYFNIDEYGLPGAQEAHIVCSFTDGTSIHFVPTPMGDGFYVKTSYPDAFLNSVSSDLIESDYLDAFCDQLEKSNVTSQPAAEVALLAKTFVSTFDKWRDLLAERVANVIQTGNDYARPVLEGTSQEIDPKDVDDLD